MNNYLLLLVFIGLSVSNITDYIENNWGGDPSLVSWPE